MNPILRAAAATAVALLAGLATLAALPVARAEENPAKVRGAQAEPATVLPGGTVAVQVDVEVDEPFHVYGLAEKTGLPPKFVAPKAGWPAGLTPGAPTESPAPEMEESAGAQLLVHKGKVTFSLPFAVAADATPGAREVTGEIELQTCDDKMCLTPERFPFTAKFWVTEPSTVKVARVAFVPETAAAGATASVEVELSIAKGWHIYAQRQSESPPKFKWTLPSGWKETGALVEVTPPHEAELYGDKYWIHEDRAVLRQVFQVPADATPGKVEVRGLGKWQRCDETGCTDDKDVPVAAMVSVIAAGGGAVPAGQQVRDVAPPPPPAEEPAPAAITDAAQARSIWSILLSGAVWGLITILTPCVFPLLPVTVSFFAKQKGPALPRSIVYSLGIIFTLTVIGLVFKGGLDLLARGTPFNLGVGVLFIVLALSLFGLFELRLPSFLIDKSQERGAAGGLIGAFFMAVVLALTSFACSAPFLAIMFTRFDRGEQLPAVLGLLSYSTTVALPFFFCSLFPALLKAMPRSGGWLNAVKVTMGFVEFGLAFKFLRTVTLNQDSDMLPRSLLLALWVACAVGAALYLLGFITLPHDTKFESIGVVRLLFALMFLTMALYFAPGMFGRPLSPTIDGFIQTKPDELEMAGAHPRGDGPGGGAAAEEIVWGRNDWNGALSRAALKDRPALFDFTGVG